MVDIYLAIGLAFVPPIITVIAMLVLFAVRDVWLNNKNIRRKNRRDIVEKKLMHLYSPIYANLKIGTQVLGKRSLIDSKPAREKNDGKLKEQLDSIIRTHYFLASKRLQPFLAKIYGAGFYHISDEDVSEMLDYIEEDYNALRDEYYQVNQKRSWFSL